MRQHYSKPELRANVGSVDNVESARDNVDCARATGKAQEHPFSQLSSPPPVICQGAPSPDVFVWRKKRKVGTTSSMSALVGSRPDLAYPSPITGIATSDCRVNRARAEADRVPAEKRAGCWPGSSLSCRLELQ